MFLSVITAVTNTGYRPEILFILALVSITFAISVITVKNPIISVLFLIGLFMSISLYLMSTGLYFIGLSYLLVYVGAVSILFLFILMLINVRVSELVTEGKNSLPLAIIAVLSFDATVNTILPYSTTEYHSFFKNILSFQGSTYNSLYSSRVSDENIIMNIINNTELSNIFGNSWDGAIIDNSHITAIGNSLYTNYFIWIGILSLILLLSIVGTIVITVKK